MFPRKQKATILADKNYLNGSCEDTAHGMFEMLHWLQKQEEF